MKIDKMEKFCSNDFMCLYGISIEYVALIKKNEICFRVIRCE